MSYDGLIAINLPQQYVQVEQANITVDGVRSALKARAELGGKVPDVALDVSVDRLDVTRLLSLVKQNEQQPTRGRAASAPSSGWS